MKRLGKYWFFNLRRYKLPTKQTFRVERMVLSPIFKIGSWLIAKEVRVM